MGVFVNFPSELVLSIAGFLEYSWDVNSLAAVNHYFHQVLDPWLHQHKQQYSRASSILWGAQHGSLQIIRKLLVDIQDQALWETAVRLAAKHGQTQVVQLFLDARPEEASEPSSSNWLCYLLWRAASEGHETLVRHLLQRGASPTTKVDYPGGLQSPLFAAVAKGHLSVVKAIISTTGTGRIKLDNLLFPAAENRHSDIVCYLLQKGANPNARNARGFHITYHAAWQCPEPGVRYLLELGADANPPMTNGAKSPLRVSLENGRIDIATLLLPRILANGGDIDMSGPEFLCAAAACGLEDVVQRLLLNGADPNTTVSDIRTQFAFKYNCTPLIWATEFKHLSIVQLLLNHGAKPTPQALIMALLTQSVPIAELLLDKGSLDPNTCWKDFLTPAIHIALKHSALFKLLLDRGADPTIPTPVPTSIMLKALAQGQVSQVQMLLDRGHALELPVGWPHKNALLTCATQGGVPMLELLFNNGFEVVLERNDAMAVTVAIKKSDLNALEFLLTKKNLGLPPAQALLSAVETIGISSKNHTHTAEAAGRILDLLLEHGFDINARKDSNSNGNGNTNGGSGQTCLCGAIRREDSTFLKILLDRGANPMLIDNQGESALYAAAAKGFIEGVRMILEWVQVRLCSQSRNSNAPGGIGIGCAELRAQVSKAVAGAAAQELWKIVRILERFEYTGLPYSMSLVGNCF
ncbi:ankyrin repeat-containing domain protein [Aspergillus falconensis]